MKIWQADFYQTSIVNLDGKIIWKLLICNPQGQIIHEADCLRSEANSDWLVSQIASIPRDIFPSVIEVFRPQALGLITLAGRKLEIPVTANRHTQALKTLLEQRQITTSVEQSPPQPIADRVLGKEWRFATLPAAELVEFFSSRPIPILSSPDYLDPMYLGLSSTLPIPGVIIYGDRKSMSIAQWLQEVNPCSINYIPTEIGQSGGMVLEAGLVERWVIATFSDTEMSQFAQKYEQKKQVSKGLHFLLVQPDDSGMTYTGFWLLQSAE